MLPSSAVAPASEAELEELLSRPTRGVVGALAGLSGDLVLLGGGGKVGPTLARMARRALDDGVVLAPGNVYSASQSAANFMRFNVAQCGGVGLTAKLERAMNRAMLARG